MSARDIISEVMSLISATQGILTPGVEKSAWSPTGCSVTQKIIVPTGQTSQMFDVGLNITDIIHYLKQQFLH
jgi:hypothetical protein